MSVLKVHPLNGGAAHLCMCAYMYMYMYVHIYMLYA